MIQSLPSQKNEWVLLWLELEEPLVLEDDVILPTLVLVSDARGVALCPPEILRELEQSRVEYLLSRLMEKHGSPGRLVIQSSPEWEEEAWEDFSRDTGIKIRFQELEQAGIVEVLKDAVSEQNRGDLESNRSALAARLLQTAQRLRSPRRREAYLKKCLSLDASMHAARIELADLEFSKGEWKNCLASYSKILKADSGAAPLNWQDKISRPFLRAHYGRAMTLWHQGKHGEAAAGFLELLRLCPEDNQGARFFVPLLFLLGGRIEDAQEYFVRYSTCYPKDLTDPAMMFGWGFCMDLAGEETAAKQKYQEGMLKNIYLAPLLLELPEPTSLLWFPSDRAEPGYASEFLDSYSVLWDQNPGALRLVRETWEDLAPRIEKLIRHRSAMMDYQDQRYDPDYRKKWEELVRRDDELCSVSSAE